MTLPSLKMSKEMLVREIIQSISLLFKPFLNLCLFHRFNDDHFLASFHLGSDMNRLNENQSISCPCIRISFPSLEALSYKPAPVIDMIIRSTPQYDSNKIIILSTLCFVVMILIILLLIALFYLNN